MSRTRIQSCALALCLLRDCDPPRVSIDGLFILTELYVEYRRRGRRANRFFLHRHHCTDGFGRQYELARPNINLRQARQYNIVSTARVDNQEFAVAAELTSVENPTITG